MRAQDTERDEEFHGFVTGRWPRLLRTAYLLAGDRHTAEDLVQSALERAYVAWGRVRRADDPDAYVRRILVNEHARRFRRRPREQLVTAVPDHPGRDGFAQLDERAALMHALTSLPPRQRQAVVLRYWEDLSESQTALAMGCSVGTVKSQASKGLAKLRSALPSAAVETRVGGAA
ncbi:SigE family RNA polymerase sigma factor [Peterkaempfera bronchialis]|uniref:SigE family RNA polymerase sigma factor n=1 Tax=Peterkaempfera bronchialis TaxID=2126346 RepID=A0A345T014_9ACTN|nr:SigE family RNA polymerase sigma factor [Peterkaempfera bronchialis]AXI79319.1 SigE family RNA polymerase sigma factor [Peterkaempfera bronchialis]